jgi:hypothetical protein
MAFLVLLDSVSCWFSAPVFLLFVFVLAVCLRTSLIASRPYKMSSKNVPRNGALSGELPRKAPLRELQKAGFAISYLLPRPLVVFFCPVWLDSLEDRTGRCCVFEGRLLVTEHNGTRNKLLDSEQPASMPMESTPSSFRALCRNHKS